MDALALRVKISVGRLPWSIVIGDFDDDGHSDLAVANRGANTVILLFGQGDGHFAAGSNVEVGGEPVSVAAGDLNNDGHLDLSDGEFWYKHCVHLAGARRWPHRQCT